MLKVYCGMRTPVVNKEHESLYNNTTELISSLTIYP